jgi:short-subunit dehydrogenase
MPKQIVLLTGASSGIGKAIAQQLGRSKTYFPILVSRNPDQLSIVTRQLDHGDYFPCDITDSTQVEALAEYVISNYGQIDVLINNAGYGKFGGALETSISDYRGMMETNYLGTVQLTQAILPLMLQQGRGKIINIASVAALTGTPNLAAYCASKFALLGFSEALQLEFSPQIQVGVLCPGPVQTPFFQEKDPATLFPPFILRHLLDADYVARQAIQLIKRPRVKVIPSVLSKMLLLKRWLPSLFIYFNKKLYNRFFNQEQSKTSSTHTIPK